MKIVTTASWVGAVCLALVASASVQAAGIFTVPISNIYNTGMSTPWNAAQAPIAGTNPGVAADSHWSANYDLAGPPPSLADHGAETYAADAPTGGQLDLGGGNNVNNSQWIHGSAGPVESGTIVTYFAVFTTSPLATSVNISGFFKTNSGIGVLSAVLDGVNVTPGGGFPASANHGPAAPSVPFAISAGTSGTSHTLSFSVLALNAPGHTLDPAIRIQFTNATYSFPVPEPSTMVLGALSIVGFGATRLRRRLFGAAQAK